MSHRILFVDDEVMVLRQVVRMIGDQYEVDTARSGKEALEAISTCGPYSVLLSDMRMSGMDGLAFLRLAQKFAPDTPCIVLTGCRDVRLTDGETQEGAVFRLLLKPCSATTLLGAIEDAVRKFSDTHLDESTPKHWCSR